MANLINEFRKIGYRGQSVLFHSTNSRVVNRDDIEELANAAVLDSDYTSVDFSDIPSDYKERIDFLYQYKGQRLIVKDVFESGRGISHSTKEVFNSMRSSELSEGTSYLMFDYNPNSLLYLNQRHVRHPMYNWCQFVDLSESDENSVGSGFTRIKPIWGDF